MRVMDGATAPTSASGTGEPGHQKLGEGSLTVPAQEGRGWGHNHNCQTEESAGEPR